MAGEMGSIRQEPLNLPSKGLSKKNNTFFYLIAETSASKLT